jgi:hypothetical protein
MTCLSVLSTRTHTYFSYLCRTSTVVAINYVQNAEGAGIEIDHDTVLWIKNSTTLFYAWHWYGFPSKPDDAIKSVQALGNAWHLPTFATEFMSCSLWKAAAAANISHSYWHYSAYCTVCVSRQKSTLDDLIDSHACSLEALACV